jgi:HSP20 family protein
MAEAPVEVKKETRERKEVGAPASPAGLENLWLTGLDSWKSFRTEMDRMFDQFWRGNLALPTLRQAFEPERLWRFAPSFGMAVPAVDLVEEDTDFRLTAEMPGMTEKDIDVTVSGDMVTIKGEKREEKKEKTKNYFFSERRYGSVQRSLALPAGVDRDKINAAFKNGVLTVTLPKTAEAVKQQKKIDVKAE